MRRQYGLNKLISGLFSWCAPAQFNLQTIIANDTGGISRRAVFKVSNDHAQTVVIHNQKVRHATKFRLRHPQPVPHRNTITLQALKQGMVTAHQQLRLFPGIRSRLETASGCSQLTDVAALHVQYARQFRLEQIQQIDNLHHGLRQPARIFNVL